jgi:protease PrsW
MMNYEYGPSFIIDHSSFIIKNVDYGLILCATLPGLLVCYAVFRMDKYDREPVLPLLANFTLGAFATIPAVAVQRWGWGQLSGNGNMAWWQIFLLAFIVIALNEEFFKWLCVRIGAYPHAFFNEPLDGIVYSVMAAIGFATVENIVYADYFGWPTAMLRTLTAMPAHLTFAIVQGYFIGLAKFNPAKSKQLMFKAIGLSVLLHGLYDWCILQHKAQWLLVLATASVYMGLYMANRLFREHLENSSFR